MIAKRGRGNNAPGLIRYLLGPGRHNEHTNPRVVAGGESVSVPRSETLSPEEISTLAFEMDLPRRIFGTRVERKVNTPEGPKRVESHVWHVSLTNPAEDPALTDEQWSKIAHDLMDRLGFSEAPGRAPCPWVAIHHGANGGGQDHIHIAVSLVQEDGSIASVWQDLVKLSQFCRETEIGYGLQAVRGRPGQAKAAAGRSEAEAARRRGHPEPDRLALQRAVRAAATQATSEADFVRNLRAAKLVVRPRYAEGGRSSVVGYSVAIRADRPIWYGGGKLARDLTLPALRLTWATDAADRQAALTEWRGPASAAVPGITYGVAAVRQAAAEVQRIARSLASLPPGDVAAWSAVASHAAGVLAHLSARLEAGRPGPLAEAADALAAAAQRPRDPAHTHTDPAKNLRGVAAVAAQAMLPGGPAAWLALLSELRRVAEAVRAAHAARNEAGAAAAQAVHAQRQLEAVHTRYIALAPGQTLAQPAPVAEPIQAPITKTPAPVPGFGR